MAARSIASLSISFGLVSIPVKLYSATQSSTAVHFKLMGSSGARLRQQYVAEPTPAEPLEEPPPPRRGPPGRSMPATTKAPEPADAKAQSPSTSSRIDVPPPPAVIERSEMVKGYEFEKGKFVLFTPDELKALQEASRQTIDIVSFIPERSVDPIYYDKAYYLTPDKRGAKPYTLLLRAMQESGRCALAKWAWRSKEYVVQIRPGEGGLVLQQLLYADEVRQLSDFDIALAEVSDAEVQLALRLIEQISQDSYDPTLFVDEEKQRILAAVEQKIAGKEVVAPAHSEATSSATVIDLMDALRASLKGVQTKGRSDQPRSVTADKSVRKPAKRVSAGADRRETKTTTQRTRNI